MALLFHKKRERSSFCSGGGHMYNVAILEANQNQSNMLKALIERNQHQEVLDIVQCPSIIELAKYLSDGNVASMLFVDVWMGEVQRLAKGRSLPKGIEIVNKYQRYFSRAQVIYMSELEHYTPLIYETEHTFFLPKPFVQQDVNIALSCAFNHLSGNNNNSLPVKIGTSVRLIKYADILYIESQRRKLRIHTANEVIDIYGSLSAMAASLPDQFIQCHKSFIVNLDYAVELQKEGFIMASGEKIAVIQTKRKEARHRFLNHLSVDFK